MLIDSHCHLDSEKFADETDELVARARAAGVGSMVTIGTRISRSAEVQALADRYKIWCSVGSHPEYAEEESVTTEQIVAHCAHPRVVGIGETGLDFFYSPQSADAQTTNFRAHIAAARQTGLPVIIHTRAADKETIAILRAEMAAGPFTGVLHCFSGGRELAEAAVQMGLYISVSGIVTFKNAGELCNILRDVPEDHLLVETDAPYLAPVPKRGGRNEPAYVVHTAAKLAELKGLSQEGMAEVTNGNFWRLFTKASL